MQERFKQLLEEKNLTATRFAAMIKVNASAMSHILNGRSKPGFDVLDKIAQAFPDVNLNWLISGKGAIHNNRILPTEIPAQEKEKENTQDSSVNTTAPEVEKSQPPLMASGVSGNGCKKIKRIVLFFEDGSFEDYEK
ncbi:MAG: helix-turn-helix domain-containing protein [Odoribacter sp.]|nr:helix-turn-helix domain-containing protein [Odoribacter sp.]